MKKLIVVLGIVAILGLNKGFVSLSGDEVDTPGINVVKVASVEDPGRGGIGYVVDPTT